MKLLNAIGYGVHLLEKEKCCGVALISNGLIDKARKQGAHNIDIIRRTIKEDDRTVVATSSTCAFTLRDEYPNLLGIANTDVRDRIELATRFVYRLIEEEKIELVFKEGYRKQIAYHTPCHMEKLGWGIYSTSLLQMIPGIQLRILPSNCCGIAGTYGFKRENYQTSQEIGKSLFRAIKTANPDVVATDCETCKWQIEMSTNYKVMHPISILAEALDVEKTKERNRR